MLAAGRLPEKDTASGQGLPRPQGLFDGSGGDVGCAWQVDHFTVVAEEVKTTGPIIAHNKNVYTVGLDIRDFLLPALLRNNLIHIADSFGQGCTDPDDLIYNVSILCTFYGFYTAELSLNSV